MNNSTGIRESEEYFSSHNKTVLALITGTWTQREWA